jgi:hypothetical protein
MARRDAARLHGAARRRLARERVRGEGKGPVRAESTDAHYRLASRSGVPAREKDREKDRERERERERDRDTERERDRERERETERERERERERVLNNER